MKKHSNQPKLKNSLTVWRTYGIRGLALVFGLLLFNGCSDGPSRRSDFQTPRERLEFKQSQINSYEKKLTPSQRDLLMRHPANNRAEFETFRDRLIESNEVKQRAADAKVDLGSRTQVLGEQSIYQEEGDVVEPFDTGRSPVTEQKSDLTEELNKIEAEREEAEDEIFDESKGFNQ